MLLDKGAITGAKNIDWRAGHIVPGRRPFHDRIAAGRPASAAAAYVSIAFIKIKIYHTAPISGIHHVHITAFECHDVI